MYNVIEIEELNINPSAWIGNFVTIRPKVIIGEGSEIRNYCFLAEGCEIGINTRIFQYTNIGAWCIVGNNVYIGPRCSLVNDRKLVYLREEFKPKSVIVEDYVRVGAGVIILPGVTIGENAKIGAGSLVRKNVPKEELWSGHPAKFICKIPQSEIK